MQILSWQMTAPGAPLQLAERSFDVDSLGDEQALVEVAGCGVCHTDLGFYYDGVRTRRPLPLTLGHEIAGRVVRAGRRAGLAEGAAVVVPAVIPCGSCPDCRRGRGAVCKRQFFPGNDDHGGFASHVVVPARGLAEVDDAALSAAGLPLATLAVIADAVTTPYQAIHNAQLEPGQVAVFIGVGGVGGFGVQIARHLGARVVAIDVDPLRLVGAVGAELRVPAGDPREVKTQLRSWAKSEGLSESGWRIFETSGHPKGQELAWSLLGYDSHLAVVGYTMEKITIRLSNLMAFDATVRGTWGCLPEHYPAVVKLVLAGAVDIAGVTELRPMSEINTTFEDLHHHRLTRRPVLVPDFG